MRFNSSLTRDHPPILGGNTAVVPPLLASHALNLRTVDAGRVLGAGIFAGTADPQVDASSAIGLIVLQNDFEPPREEIFFQIKAK